MNKPVPFTCPKCGHEVLKESAESRSYDELLGATCANCGYTITENDIRKQAVKFVEGFMRDFKRHLK